MKIKSLFLGIVLILTSSSVMAHDVNGDGLEGLPEAIHALQVAAGDTPPTMPTVTGLNFDITSGGETFTSQSQGWTFAGATRTTFGGLATFITDKGYVFESAWGPLNAGDFDQGVQAARVYYTTADCSGQAYIMATVDILRFSVFRLGSELAYVSRSDSLIDALSIAAKSYSSDDCSPMSSGITNVLPVYPNDPAVTGVDFPDPIDISIIPHVDP